MNLINRVVRILTAKPEKELSTETWQGRIMKDE